MTMNIITPTMKHNRTMITSLHRDATNRSSRHNSIAHLSFQPLLKTSQHKLYNLSIASTTTSKHTTHHLLIYTTFTLNGTIITYEASLSGFRFIMFSFVEEEKCRSIHKTMPNSPSHHTLLTSKNHHHHLVAHHNDAPNNLTKTAFLCPTKLSPLVPQTQPYLH